MNKWEELIIKYDKEVLNLQQENKQLQKQLDYLRSGEYYNQLRFERDMLQDIVDNGEISKEDREFIDCTHRNTELLEENKQLKDNWNRLKEWLEAMRRMYEDEYKDVDVAEDYNCVLKQMKFIKEGKY